MPAPGRAITFWVGLLATVVLGWVIHVGASILKPLVIAVFLCSMLQPVVRFLAKRRIPPQVTVIALVSLLFWGAIRGGYWVQARVLEFVTTAPEAIEKSTLLELPAGVQLPDDGGQVASLDGGDPDEPRTSKAESESDGSPGTDGGPLTNGDPESVGAPGADGDPSSEGEGTEGDPATGESDEAGGEPDENGADESAKSGWAQVKAGLVGRLRETELPPDLVVYIEDALEQLHLADVAAEIVGGSVDFLRALTLVVIYMLFIFAEQAIFRRKILSVAGERAEEAEGMLDHIAQGLQRYLSVKTVVSLATGLLCYSVLKALDVQYAALFGVMTFLLNYIPTFGSIAAGMVASATVLAVQGSVANALIVALAYLVVNLGLGSYLEPKILGRELDLSPLVIIISVVLWAGLWGIIGTFLAVPLTATIQIVLASNENTRPVAVLLSSGPPKDPPPKRKRKSKSTAAA